MWFYTTIYHELCKLSTGDKKKTLEELKTKMMAAMSAGNMNEAIALGAKIKEEEEKGEGTAVLAWAEIADLIYSNEYCDTFCYEFVKRTANSEETDNDGNVYEDIKTKYVQSIMTMYLTSRPRSAAARNVGVVPSMLQEVGQCHSTYHSGQHLQPHHPKCRKQNRQRRLEESLAGVH